MNKSKNENNRVEFDFEFNLDNHCPTTQHHLNRTKLHSNDKKTKSSTKNSTLEKNKTI